MQYKQNLLQIKNQLSKNDPFTQSLSRIILSTIHLSLSVYGQCCLNQALRIYGTLNTMMVQGCVLYLGCHSRILLLQYSPGKGRNTLPILVICILTLPACNSAVIAHQVCIEEQNPLALRIILLTHTYLMSDYSQYTAAGWQNENSNTVLRPCLLYTSPSPRDRTRSRMPSSA